MTTEANGTRTRAEVLADRMRDDIAANVLTPGQRLTEIALAESYGTSRTPVREALRILSQEVLLEYVPNWGYRVARLRLRDLDDLYAVRLAIETQAVRRLAEGGGDTSRVKALLEQWTPTEVPGYAGVQLIFADEHYHQTLADASGGSVLGDLLRSINRRLHTVRIREFIDDERIVRTYEQHAAILRAILEGDTELAPAAMRSHILEGRQFVRRSALDHGLIVSDSECGEEPL